jgi:hypothetical protein
MVLHFFIFLKKKYFYFLKTNFTEKIKTITYVLEHVSKSLFTHLSAKILQNMGFLDKIVFFGEKQGFFRQHLAPDTNCQNFIYIV